MRTAITFLIISFSPVMSSAQSAIEILSKGKVISSSALTDYELPEYGSPTPNDMRIHEAYVIYNDTLFLCHLTGARGNNTYPAATCFGNN